MRLGFQSAFRATRAPQRRRGCRRWIDTTPSDNSCFAHEPTILFCRLAACFLHQPNRAGLVSRHTRVELGTALRLDQCADGPIPHAAGNGVADDTAALQAALDRLSANPGEPNTIYLPAGTYRITRTLVVKQKDGIALIGHGRGTRIVWDGPGGKGEDARMFWSNGAPRSRYVGITWDGRGKAYVGFDHDSKGYFETEINHQHEAFLDFMGSGIRIGHDQVQATAKTTYVNCLFSNCESGLSLMQFNDYNHTVAGCEFRDCGCGINASAGPTSTCGTAILNETRQ